ncbi:MAG TPA: CheR family methyltransferase [Pseudolabrys sp.]|nr:CheR family methyltransferase [Pseudolabrys sp.]
MDEDEKINQDEDNRGPFVVGIGASAGGIQALQAFFGELPDEPGAAFVVIVHLDPDVQSELAAILANCTDMPVTQVTESEPLQVNQVYVIPPDRRLHITDNQIVAAPFDEPHGQRAPVDLFFRSLAAYGDGFAIVFSGAGSDGVLGVRAVKEAGGIILVQEPDEAEYGSMPRAAVATGLADVVLPVQHLAGRLVELIHIKATSPPAGARDGDEDLLRRVLAHLRVRTGHDFSKYKRSTMLRRIARRMQVTRTADLKEYHEFLRENPDEAQALLSDLLISVTTFFRDREAFESLRSQVIPQLFAGKEVSQPIRVWVPGCASGEEAYSIAMLLLEEAGRRELRPPIQIFASDIDGRALAAAREGQFPRAIEADVTDDRLRRFFTPEKDGYRIRQEARDLVLFANHDVLKDPPFSRIDLIACRNLMIYLDRDLQEQTSRTFHYALKPGGFLFLGSAETADNPPGLFRTVDRNARIYQSGMHTSEKPRLLPRLLGSIGGREHGAVSGRGRAPEAALNEAILHRRLIERLAPPSILVDEAHRVIHLSENAGRFLQPSGGSLNTDLVELARPELRFELRSALHRAFEQRLPTLSLPIPVRFNGTARRVHLNVKPVEKGEGEQRHAVVMFIEGGEIEQDTAAPDQRQASDNTVQRLSEELELTQARLRTVREESEASTEELRAANEELQSINEEYRSTSEELETSKEELQSINEELQTVNSELKLKLEAISRAHSDLQNLMAATDIGTLFLDTTLRVKRFTERTTDLFSLTAADEGRPITDFAHRLDYDGLVGDARAVLTELAPIRREIHSRDGRWYDVRLRPYRTVDNKIDGVVITFLDITERLQIESALRESERRLSQQNQLVQLSRDPIFIWDYDDGILQWNRGCGELYGYTAADAIGKTKLELLGTTVPGSSFDALKEQLLRDGHWSGELRQRTKDGRMLTIESRMQFGSMEGKRLVLESTRDITERKTWEERQQLLLRELTHRVKNTLAVAQSIANQTLRTTRSQADFVERFSARLAALGAAHGLLVQSDWEGADMEAMARAQLEPYLADGFDRVHITGAPISLPAELATPFGLVLHELAANAAKYGALSTSAGRVDLHWGVTARNNGRLLTVVWEEKGGPPPKRGPKAGFGSILIDQSIPNAKVNRDFSSQGFTCTIALSLTELLINDRASKES